MKASGARESDGDEAFSLIEKGDCSMKENG